MLLSWFDTKEVDALADKLAGDFVKKSPPAQSAAASKKADAKMRRSHDLILRQAREFSESHSLNVYKKARLANRFKWALVEAGYAQGFVNEVAYELAAVMSGRSK